MWYLRALVRAGWSIGLSRRAIAIACRLKAVLQPQPTKMMFSEDSVQ